MRLRSRYVRPVTLKEVLANIKAFNERRDELRLAPDVTPTCPDCEDTRVRVFINRDGVRCAAPCSCRSRFTGPAEIYDCPAELLDARLENFNVCLETAHAVQAAREFAAVEDPRRHLCFNGKPGRGKTRLAISAARARVDRGEPAAFISVPWLIALAQRGIDDARKRAEAANLEDHAIATPVVILDDVAGGEKGSDFARGILTRILDRRYSKQLRTIITSNFDLPRLAQYYNDERVVSRLAEMCGETFELGGPDRRLAPLSSAARHGNLRVVKDGQL
jgi:DNA replication protein DnaC